MAASTLLGFHQCLVFILLHNFKSYRQSEFHYISVWLQHSIERGQSALRRLLEGTAVARAMLSPCDVV